MCNAAAVGAGQGFGAAQSAVGSYYQASSQKAALGLQATLADINASTAENAAEAALFSGQRQEQASRLQTANLKAKQVTSMAANGVDLGQGSAARVLTTTDVMGEIDANTINANAVRAAWGQRTQATNYANQALMSRSAAKAISPVGALATSLLGSATKVAGSWYTMGKQGAFTSPETGGGDALEAFGSLNNWFGTGVS
jgi:hypothetical protein